MDLNLPIYYTIPDRALQVILRFVGTRQSMQVILRFVGTQNLFTLPDTALQIILRFVGAHNLEVTWRCTACNPYWYGWHCPVCEIPLRLLHWTPKFHFGYCGEKCGCCRTAKGAKLSGCLECDDLKRWKVTSKDAREQLRHFKGVWCLWQFGHPFSWRLKQSRFLWVSDKYFRDLSILIISRCTSSQPVVAGLHWGI